MPALRSRSHLPVGELLKAARLADISLARTLIQERAERVTPIQFSRAEAVRSLFLRGLQSVVAFSSPRKNFFALLVLALAGSENSVAAGAALGSDNLAEVAERQGRSVFFLSICHADRDVSRLDGSGRELRDLEPHAGRPSVPARRAWLAPGHRGARSIVAGLGLPIPEDIMLFAAGVLVHRGEISYVGGPDRLRDRRLHRGHHHLPHRAAARPGGAGAAAAALGDHPGAARTGRGQVRPLRERDRLHGPPHGWPAGADLCDGRACTTCRISEVLALGWPGPVRERAGGHRHRLVVCGQPRQGAGDPAALPLGHRGRAARGRWSPSSFGAGCGAAKPVHEH